MKESPKKRRSRINREEYDFLFPINSEQIAVDYDEDKIKQIASNVFDFYTPRIINFTPSKTAFTNLFLSYSRNYNPKVEINYYYYIKTHIELYYKMNNYKHYFSNREEAAFKVFISSDGKRREIIYDKFLKYPFDKLVENIINTYKLRLVKMSYEDQHCSTMSFLHEKVTKFKPNKNTKAFSYFGTIVKRFLINKKKKEAELLKKHSSFELIKSHIVDNVEFSYLEKRDENNLNVEFFYKLKKIMETYVSSPEKIDFLTDQDLNVGNAIMEIMDKWEEIFEDLDKGDVTNRFQKKYVFEILRNYTGLTTPEISRSLKIFKTSYKLWKNDYVTSIYNPFDDLN